MKSRCGFRETSNTEYEILEFMDNVYNLINDSGCFVVVYIDLPYAINTDNYNIMLGKVQHIGDKR